MGSRNNEPPQTIEEATEMGWHGLTLECRPCKRTVFRSWSYLRSRSYQNNLAVIIARLKCGQCRRPPNEIKLALEKIGADGKASRFEKIIWTHDGRVVRPART